MAKKGRRERVAWLEPFGRGALVARTLARVAVFALLAFSWVSIPASLGRPVGLVTLVIGAGFATIVVPVLTLLLDRSRVALEADAVAVRRFSGLLPPGRTAFADLERATVTKETGLGGRREHTLRLFARGYARAVTTLAVARAEDPKAVVAALGARGLACRLEDATGERRPFARTFVVAAALLAAIAWSARAAVVGAERERVAAFTSFGPSIACVRVEPDGRLAIRVDGFGDVLDVRVGRATFSGRAVAVERTPAGGSVVRVTTGSLDARSQGLVSVSRSLPGGGVESIGAPFDPARSGAQGPRC